MREVERGQGRGVPPESAAESIRHGFEAFFDRHAANRGKKGRHALPVETIAVEAHVGAVRGRRGPVHHCDAGRLFKRRETREPRVVSIEKLPLPRAGGPGGLAVVGEIYAFGKADQNRVGPDAFHEGALHDRMILWDEFKLAGNRGRKTFRLAVRAFREGIDGGDLLRGVAAEDLQIRGLPRRPKRRHQRAGAIPRGVDQIIHQPAGLNALPEIAQVERLNAERRPFAPPVAGDAPDATESAEQLASGGIVAAGQGRLRLLIHFREQGRQGRDRGSVDRHLRFEVRAHACLAREHVREPGRLQLAAHAGQRGRVASRVAEVVIALEVSFARRVRAAAAVALMAGGAVQRLHGERRELCRWHGLIALRKELLQRGSLRFAEVKFRHAAGRARGQAAAVGASQRDRFCGHVRGQLMAGCAAQRSH